MSGYEPAPSAAGVEFVRGESGLGIHRLFIGLNVTLGSGGMEKLADLTALGADLFVQGAAGGGQRYLGRLRPVGDARVVARGTQARERVVFEIDLSRSQLEALEGVRQGQDFWLVVKAEWRLSWGQHDQQRHVLLDGWTRQVTQSDWATLRRDMGVARTWLLEVPAPSADECPELVGAVTRWEEAHAAWLSGRAREAVALCRQALEAIPAGPEPNSNTTDRSKEERIEAVRRALRNVCHPAAHMDPVSQSIVWERPHAEFLISATAALLALYTRCPWAPGPGTPTATHPATP
jgi:hypothetical protein